VTGCDVRKDRSCAAGWPTQFEWRFWYEAPVYPAALVGASRSTEPAEASWRLLVAFRHCFQEILKEEALEARR